MALVAFIRGVNVGGHRRFRPSVFAKDLGDFDVVNVGAAGTFVVRSPRSSGELRAALLRKLPFKAETMICDARDLVRLATGNPFGREPTRRDVVRFVSILPKARRVRAFMPIRLPSEGKWLVRILAVKKQFIFGVYRRHMRTIRYLGRIDELFGVPVTTRNWNTIMAVVRILKAGAEAGRG